MIVPTLSFWNYKLTVGNDVLYITKISLGNRDWRGKEKILGHSKAQHVVYGRRASEFDVFRDESCQGVSSAETENNFCC